TKELSADDKMAIDFLVTFADSIPSASCEPNELHCPCTVETRNDQNSVESENRMDINNLIE
ncbi:2110_t:CDS:2, partial [Paraglomus brasilianum]